MADYPRYQYSKFDDNGGQYVVRADDKEEFELDVTYIKAILGTTTKAVVESVDEDRDPLETKPCPIHEGKSLYRKEGKFGTFYSHKVGDDAKGKPVYCNGYEKGHVFTDDYNN